MKNYNQLTLNQRYQIYALLKAKRSKTEIADIIKVHKSTITRELQRNVSKRGYRPLCANTKAQKRRGGKAKKRISDDTWREVEEKIELDQWSPEQISGRRSIEGKQHVSHEWIYQRIYKDKRNGGSLYKHLRCQKERRKRYGSYDRRGALKNQVSIEERPEIVEKKSRLGDWELDTVIGKRHKQAFVTMTERRSKLLRIKKVKQKTGKLVGDAICRKLSGLKVETLTSDNGREFADHERIAAKLGADFYFCHPFSSYERGLNENTNGLVRQYFPKQTEFDKISHQSVKKVEDKLNNRPRKTLNYRTPNEVYFKEQEQFRKVALTT